MRIRAAQCAALHWDEGQLIWDDYLDHRELALTAAGEMLLRWFSEWRELASVSELGTDYMSVAERLVEEGVLIEEGSVRDTRERRVHERWGGWGPSARHFHFATRTLASTRYSTHAADVTAMREHAQRNPPPPYASEHPDRPLVPLAANTSGDAGWAHPRLLDALGNRRSTRSFTTAPVALDQLATLLELAAGIQRVDELDTGPAVFKASPSAGAWHPVELHVHARAVDGLEPGVYHYAPTRGGLERAPAPPEIDLLHAVGGQPWLAQAPVLILHTGVIERIAWRYATGRAYRDLLIGLGHLSQTLFLSAVALGLGAVFATAFCDQELERLIAADPINEVVLGVTAIGHPSNDDG